MRVSIMATRGEESAEGQRQRERDARNNADRNPTRAPLGHVDAALIPIHLERREPARNRQRFHALTVTRTLFDGWALVREWGRIGPPGTVRETWFETETAAIEAGAEVRQRKEKRGYHAVNGFDTAG
jgi:predicted DNA-binding WGR domain protein